jgi:23S rRNA (adenine2503-C2)-methyltransferase
LLAEQISLQALSTRAVQSDPKDGTIKIASEMNNGSLVESVLMPDSTRVSVCLSSQAGCAMGCVFCATGTQGFTSNLTSGEIVAQLLNLQLHSLRRITHVVLMGMGEPLLNLDNVLNAIRIMAGEIGISMRHITLSTVGVIKGIERLADEALPITLALSLHAPTDELRAQIVPSHKGSTTLAELLNSCRHFFGATGRRITMEYVLLRGVNDRSEDAEALLKLLKNFPCAINVIPYNPVNVAGSFKRPETERIRNFRKILEDGGLTVTQRKERGQRIDAACGQLISKQIEAV